MELSLSPIFALPEYALNDFTTEWPVPAFIFDKSCLIAGQDSWLGPDDLSAKIQVAWNAQGLFVRARVRDNEVIADLPDNQLYLRDALEVFLAPQDGLSFPCGPTLQAIFSAPALDGTVRHAVYCQSPTSAVAFEACGRRVSEGYELQVLFRWDLFGKTFGPSEGQAFRMQFHLDDWVSRDDGDKSVTQSRMMSLNGICHRRIPTRWYSFQLVGDYDLQRDYDISPYCPPLNISTLICDNRLLLPAIGCEVQYDIVDAATGERLAVLPPTTEETQWVTPLRKEPYELKVIAHLRREDCLTGHLTCQVTDASGIIGQIRPLVLDAAAPDRQVQALGLLSCVEFLKVNLDRAKQELEWRLRLLDGEDVSQAPGPLAFLNLMGDSDGQATVGISRRVPDLANVTVSWGTLPVLYASVRVFPTDEAAADFVSEQLTFKRQISPETLSGFDEAWLWRGHLLGDALPWDIDLEHLVTVTCRRNHHAVLRLVPEVALTLSPVGYVCYEDAPAAMVMLMEQAGLPKLTSQAAEDTDGHVIHLGTGRFADFLPSGVHYYHSLNGVETTQLVARKGRIVFNTPGYLPENARELLDIMRQNRPISRIEVARWRERLLDHLGGDCPEERMAGLLVHSGEVHSHTNYSDGSGTPGGLLAEAALCGMDFLVITDHGTTLGAELLAQAQVKSGNHFPVVVGEEITNSRVYHINFFPLSRNIPQEQPFRTLLSAARAQGAIALLNHPMTYGNILRKFWYGDFRGTGLDAIERHIEYLDRWRKLGTAPVVLGSTDTHDGIFGHFERSVILADAPDGQSLATAIRQRRAGMLAPNLSKYVIADEPVVRAVRAALGNPQLPTLHAERLAAAFAETDLVCFILTAPGENKALPNYGQGDPNEVILPEPLS